MTRRLAISALFTALLVGSSLPTIAQSVSEGQSCGGLLCDMGVFGHKTAPAAPPPAPAAPAATAPSPKAAEAVPPEPDAAEPKKRPIRKKKRFAKAPAQVAAPARMAAPAPAPVAAAPAAPAAAPPPPQAAAQSAPSILNPYASPQSTTYRFRPIYQ